MEAPSGCTIAQKGSQRQHRPPSCSNPNVRRPESASRNANCALSSDSLPASGGSNRNRNSARLPPLSAAGRGRKDRPGGVYA
ncbi:uncharacterized protein LOC108292468 [Cebus imitator]|uniref:uncharacterized protein LOC108292468 n=1 Tax=Cebus imitator TaxID=2715852 RepID=UPI00189727C2|nr:uncharacterized protein LOC108292468 [Cebus imitator]